MFAGNAVARALALALMLGASSASAWAAGTDVPKPGESPRIDSIKKAGVLKVGVIANPPWLVQNMGGAGDPWSGPAWVLAKEYAKRLGVTLQPVPVSNDTKIPVLAANQVDISIAPLAQSEERLKVVDFVIYSSTSDCLFGLKSNPKFANAKSVDDLNSPDITIAYLVGASEEPWVKERFPKAKLRGVISAAVVPVEEVMAKRADAVPLNRLQWPALSKKVKGLAVLPAANNCQDSTEKSQPVGLAIDKGQTVFHEWLKAIHGEMQPQLKKIENDIVNNTN
jgi:polar amino acid transport system substrate-binding protein